MGETINKIYNNSKLSFSPVNKQIINNYTINNINNNYTINNYFFNNEINSNTNLNFNLNNQPEMFPKDQSNFMESPFFFQSSNHPSFLSIQSDMKNNFIYIWI